MRRLTVESRVSVEPPPKQGCEVLGKDEGKLERKSQWNPRRSRGARYHLRSNLQRRNCLSGTPAEAGVRDDCPM